MLRRLKHQAGISPRHTPDDRGVTTWQRQTTRKYPIRGLHCSGCADTLGASLTRVEGVIKADADYDRATIEVRLDPERVTDDDIHSRIRAAGFEPVVMDAQDG